MAIVEINGTVLSQLLHDCTVNSSEGILLGEVVKSLEDEITDDGINEQKEDVRIHITKVISCEKHCSFSDRTGRINRDKVNILLGEHKNNDIVGWFSCRHNSTKRMSFREETLHLKLVEYIQKDLETFLFGLVIPGIEEDSGFVNSCNFDFRVRKQRTFKSLPLKIINLGQRKNQQKMEQFMPRYVKTTSPLITNKSSHFNEVSSEFHAHLVNISKQQEKKITNLNSKLHEEFVDLCNNVANQELIVQQLEKKLKDLGILEENGALSSENDLGDSNDHLELEQLQHSPKTFRRNNRSVKNEPKEELLINLTDEPQYKKKASLLDNVQFMENDDEDSIRS